MRFTFRYKHLEESPEIFFSWGNFHVVKVQ